MITLNPDTPEPISTNTLLSIISNPELAKQHLSSIKQSQDNAQATMQDLDAHRDAYNKAKAEHDTTLAEVQKASDAHTQATASKTAELNDRETTVSVRERELTKRAEEFQIFSSNKATELTQRENNVTARENQTSAKESELKSMEDRLNHTQASLDAKVNAFKNYVLNAEAGQLGTAVNGLI